MVTGVQDCALPICHKSVPHCTGKNRSQGATGSWGFWNRRARRGRTVLAVVAAIVTAALIGGAILLARDKDITRPSPTFATISPGTIDPLTSQADPPRNLAGELGQDGAVTFTWEATADDWEGSYLYREIVLG